MHEALILLLFSLFYQDLKERKVTLIVLIFISLLGGYIHFNRTLFYKIFLINIGINLLVVLSIGLILYLYARLKLKQDFLKTIGLGDILFFFFLAISFPITTFLVLFSTSVIFSLILFLLLKPKLKNKTVPLAGFQALFIGLVLLVNSLFSIVNLYNF